jgi:hypothetical protein
MDEDQKQSVTIIAAQPGFAVVEARHSGGEPNDLRESPVIAWAIGARLGVVVVEPLTVTGVRRSARVIREPSGIYIFVDGKGDEAAICKTPRACLEHFQSLHRDQAEREEKGLH